jgi:hypothetical protein
MKFFIVLALCALAGCTTNTINPAFKGSEADQEIQKARTVAFLSQVPPEGKNHFMMAHGGILWEATGYVIQEEHAVVLNPRDLSVLVARISPEECRLINTKSN